MLLAFIPARKGSKGILGKNRVLLDGKPLIQYTIEAALASRYVDKILLSTDDPEIVKLGRGLGLDCSYQRPSELAADDTAMIETVIHGLQWCGTVAGDMPDEVVLLQPTSPLRTAYDIDAAVEVFRRADADTLVSVHPMTEHPSECIVSEKQGWRYLSAPPAGAVRRQDLEDIYYFINGAIYLAHTESLLKRKKFVCRGESALYIMPRERGVDIDEAFDLTFAEAMFASKK